MYHFYRIFALEKQIFNPKKVSLSYMGTTNIDELFFFKF